MRPAETAQFTEALKRPKWIPLTWKLKICALPRFSVTFKLAALLANAGKRAFGPGLGNRFHVCIRRGREGSWYRWTPPENQELFSFALDTSEENG